jgi:hypothetical protein
MAGILASLMETGWMVREVWMGQCDANPPFSPDELSISLLFVGRQVLACHCSISRIDLLGVGRATLRHLFPSRLNHRIDVLKQVTARSTKSIQKSSRRWRRALVLLQMFLFLHTIYLILSIRLGLRR